MHSPRISSRGFPSSVKYLTARRSHTPAPDRGGMSAYAHSQGLASSTRSFVENITCVHDIRYDNGSDRRSYCLLCIRFKQNALVNVPGAEERRGKVASFQRWYKPPTSSK